MKLLLRSVWFVAIKYWAPVLCSSFYHYQQQKEAKRKVIFAFAKENHYPKFGNCMKFGVLDVA